MTQAPLVARFQLILPATAAGADFVATICKAPFDGTLTAAAYVADTAITGADTDSRTINILNQGLDGATGSAVNMASKAFTASVNAAQYDETALTLSAVADATDVVEGDVITVQSLHVGGTGLADPGGTVLIELTRS